MKRIILFPYLLVVGLAGINAQSTAELAFTAELDGVHQPLDSVLVINLTQGGDTTLYGSDTVLILDYGIWTGPPPAVYDGQMEVFPAYPNPFSGTANFRIWLPDDGEVMIRLFDISGRLQIERSLYLDPGYHSFVVSPGFEKSYLLVVEALGARKVQKLIHVSRHGGTVGIDYAGHQPSASGMRTGMFSFNWEPGDMLRFIGYASPGIDTLHDNPSHSGVYCFQYSTTTIQPLYPPGTVHCDSVNPTAIVDVLNPVTGKTWMDRNLGAAQVALTSHDPVGFGDLYQWGRFSDGHQCRTSATSFVQSASAQPGHGHFIAGQNQWNNQWQSSTLETFWQGTSGENNPCPAGYRLPTLAEWTAEMQSWSSPDAAGAISSQLRLPLAGWRNPTNGAVSVTNHNAFYWTGSICSFNSANHIAFVMQGSPSTPCMSALASGRSVRCIKDTNATITLPTLTTDTVYLVTETSAFSGGNITCDGYAPVWSRGVCWSIHPNPTLADSCTSDGTGDGLFTSYMTNLDSNTTYYVRAYATNVAGTAYGNQFAITTSCTTVCPPLVTDINGNIYDVVQIGNNAGCRKT